MVHEFSVDLRTFRVGERPPSLALSSLFKAELDSCVSGASSSKQASLRLNLKRLRPLPMISYCLPGSSGSQRGPAVVKACNRSRLGFTDPLGKKTCAGGWRRRLANRWAACPVNRLSLRRFLMGLVVGGENCICGSVWYSRSRVSRLPSASVVSTSLTSSLSSKCSFPKCWPRSAASSSFLVSVSREEGARQLCAISASLLSPKNVR